MTTWKNSSSVVGDSSRENEGYIDDERAKLIRLEDELQQAVVEENLSEVDRLRDRMRDSMQNLRALIEELADTEEELREHISGLRELIESGEPPPIVLEVRVADGYLYVETFKGELGSGEAERVLAHSERVEEVDVHGVDFYNVRLTSNPVDEMTLMANGFWTGPIPSTYQEECLLELRSDAGELLWRPRDVHDVYDNAPPTEDRRDGWGRGGLGIGKKIGVPLDEIVPSFKCSAKPR